MNSLYPVTERTKLRRRPQRGAYDRASVYAILDAGVMCHVGYNIGGRPFVTPTAYWRDGDRVYWHGSAASRMLESVSGAEVCLTVSHLDGLVLARSAMHHSVNYRSAMLFGRAELITDINEKRIAMNAFVERLYPGRGAVTRPSSDKELKAIALVAMTIAEASAKVRTGGVVDDEEDYALSVWAGVIPTRTLTGASLPDTRLLVEPALPAALSHYAENAGFDAALLKSAVAGANAQK